MPTPPQRQQQTIARSAKVSGFGLFGGVDVVVEFCPAEPGHGIIFERVDLAQAVKIPALIENVIPQPRCTVISNHDVTVSVIEHVMAALAGLHIDNCLVRINAPEPPACDGSSLLFVEALLGADIVKQDELRAVIVVDQTQIVTESDHVGIGVQSSNSNEYEIGSIVDYGDSSIPRQSVTIRVTPETFVNEISNARTFVLEQEVAALQANGIGQRATPQNVLVFGESGVIENCLRYEDECARHKILDCIGDFALIGCDLIGRFSATQSGHRLNHAMIREIKAAKSREEATSTLSFPVPQKQDLNQIRAAG